MTNEEIDNIEDMMWNQNPNKRLEYRCLFCKHSTDGKGGAGDEFEHAEDCEGMKLLKEYSK